MSTIEWREVGGKQEPLIIEQIPELTREDAPEDKKRNKLIADIAESVACDNWRSFADGPSFFTTLAQERSAKRITR